MPGNSDPPCFTLIDRPLRPDEARLVSGAIRETPNILGYSPRELLALPSCLVAEAENGAFAGVCAIKRFTQKYSEITFILVLPAYRKRGIGAALFHEAFQRLRNQGYTILCISREPSILRLMEEANMNFIAEWRLPLVVHLAKMHHYSSLYRFCEGFRKGPMYSGQPPFRYAVWE